MTTIGDFVLNFILSLLLIVCLPFYATAEQQISDPEEQNPPSDAVDIDALEREAFHARVKAQREVELQEGLSYRHFRPEFDSWQRLKNDRAYNAQLELSGFVEEAIKVLIRERPTINYCRAADDLRPAMARAVPNICAAIDTSECGYLNGIYLGNGVVSFAPGEQPVADLDSCEWNRNPGMQFVTLLDRILVENGTHYRDTSYHPYQQVSIRELPAKLSFGARSGLIWACVDKTVALNNISGEWKIVHEDTRPANVGCAQNRHPQVFMGIARRRNLNIQDVPIAVTAFDADALDEDP